MKDRYTYIEGAFEEESNEVKKCRYSEGRYSRFLCIQVDGGLFHLYIDHVQQFWGHGHTATVSTVRDLLSIIVPSTTIT